MQFDPEKYPSKDYHFSVVSSLGVIAREYEVGQLAQILQVIPPQSPLHGEVLKAIIGHLNITSKEDLLAKIEAANQPNLKLSRCNNSRCSWRCNSSKHRPLYSMVRLKRLWAVPPSTR